MRIPIAVLELGRDSLFAVMEDGSALRLRVEPAADGSYPAATGERLSVQDGLLAQLGAVPQAREPYLPAP